MILSRGFPGHGDETEPVVSGISIRNRVPSMGGTARACAVLDRRQAESPVEPLEEPHLIGRRSDWPLDDQGSWCGRNHSLVPSQRAMEKFDDQQVVVMERFVMWLWDRFWGM